MDGIRRGNLLLDSQPPASGERFETLLSQRNLVIERIVSSGDTVPTAYVQSQDEWVLLLKGSAVLRVHGQVVTLNAGDYLFLPAMVPHTVERASAGALWLAVHLHQGPATESPS